jgi:hypothetical protein
MKFTTLLRVEIILFKNYYHYMFFMRFLKFLLKFYKNKNKKGRKKEKTVKGKIRDGESFARFR